LKKSIETESTIQLQTLFAIQELLRWTKVSSYENIKKMLDNVLNSENKKMIYHLSDGENNQDEIVSKGKVAAGSISKYWNEWEKLGIGESIPVKRGKRFKGTFDLNTFGLLPKSEQKEEQ
jgi:hypothetical protein